MKYSGADHYASCKIKFSSALLFELQLQHVIQGIKCSVSGFIMFIFYFIYLFPSNEDSFISESVKHMRIYELI